MILTLIGHCLGPPLFLMQCSEVTLAIWSERLFWNSVIKIQCTRGSNFYTESVLKEGATGKNRKLRPFESIICFQKKPQTTMAKGAWRCMATVLLLNPEAARQRGSMLIGTQVPLLDYQLPELFALTMGLKRLLCYHYPSH